MSYLLDTNILIYAYRDIGNCRKRLDALAPDHVHICSVNVFEIERGIAKSTRPQALRTFLDDALDHHGWANWDAKSACEAAQVRAHLERMGQPIGPYDTLLAGIALAHKLTLVTHNTKEFARVPGLGMEDWFY